MLYPTATPLRARLEHYVRRFPTVELNASFYRWPAPPTFAGWRRRLPEGFLLSVKAPRGLTHAKKLYAPDEWVQRIVTGVRAAVEVRHPSWHDDEVFNLLERRGVAYCVMSGARLPCVMRATAPFVYLRLHGPDAEHLYAGSYPHDSLAWWADRIREWSGQGRDVYAYFNNDSAGNAVRDADTLRPLLG